MTSSRGPRRPDGRTRRGALLSAVAALVLTLGGCADAPATPESERAPVLPPAGAVPDYQLGGAYDPAPEVGIVGRDRGADPAPGVYSICYVNGFQTQPAELGSWPDDLLLRHDGEVVFDPDWPDEALLDTASAERRERIADTVTAWIEGCAESGFDAVEFDNLDSYSRSDGALSLEDNLALATLYVEAAHAAGLAAGQKNAAEDASTLHERAGFDFAVTEECAVYRECGAYTAVYGEHVIDIEYTDELPLPFIEMCADGDAPSSMVLRDRDLVTPADDGYAFETCP
ncbi:endo alpha-1,4 polygalactosaminidase [Microbacterium sp. KKR3/1]|uniref:endo alpha-1,4 polygalactosaminidase n=1 Tax=Microbacterium sp. KKR3/1 TaxID=2904241 RepID=UPI001E60F550|nr:endo alpha-1,4 polygalactosaminidase [Microbacterium sp. KKR3/1]MCE0510077.1 endo alpha-1,4 polygalactosaminidase [Microbacterium sp. KKR3/1]